jgi:hypothetical protein
MRTLWLANRSLKGTWLSSRLVGVTLKNQELEMLFDLQHSRVTEATKLWQAAHDKPDVLPDLGTGGFPQ